MDGARFDPVAPIDPGEGVEPGLVRGVTVLVAAATEGVVALVRAAVRG